jgi:hypothetical protein
MPVFLRYEVQREIPSFFSENWPRQLENQPTNPK